MRRNQVEQVKPDFFGGGRKVFPFFQRKFAPEGVDEFYADADMAKQFAAQIARDLKADFRRTHLPHFAAIVNEDTREQEVAVERGINHAQCAGCSHHLRSVAKQAAAKGMVVVPSRGSAAKPRSKFLEERLSEAAETRIGNTLNSL